MAPTKVEQAAIIILDIGRNAGKKEGKDEKSFFDKARECATRIIERKIISQEKSLVGIVLLGSKDTKNEMAQQYDGAFKHISVLAELQNPTWQMIRNLPDKPSTSKGNWFDSLIVAADHFKNGISNTKMLNKKIILMTNFQSPAHPDDEQVKQVLDGFKEEKFEVDVIGLDIYEENKKSDDIAVAQHFVEATDGVTATFDYAMGYLLFHKKKTTNAVPWNVDLNIGTNIKIPVSAYIRIKDEPVTKKWLKSIKDPVTTTSSVTEAITKSKVHINTDNQNVVKDEDCIKGYLYGQQVIPFSQCDKNLLYESGERCLSIYGFTASSNVKWYNLVGDGLYYVFGRKGDKKAQDAIRCLVHCLHDLQLIGIARRVYNKGNAPKMYVLMPVIDSKNYICLSMINICYKEDIKYMTFPSTNLKMYSCTNEQINAFKDLIKEMDLTKAYDNTFDDAEAFPVAETVSPSVQYVLDCIAFRAMNPGKPLPPPRDDIMILFKTPSSIEKRSREPIGNLKKLFTLNEVEKKTRNKRKNEVTSDQVPKKQAPDTQLANQNVNADLPKVQLLNKKMNDITNIGTIDPISDFKALANKGKTLNDLSQEMTEALEHLVCYNLDGNYSKALDTFSYFRNECVKADPTYYNNWLQKFKTVLTNRKKFDILNMITEKNLGFILKTENNLSNIESDGTLEESQSYENDTIPNSTDLTIREDVNDLFDEM